MNLYSIDFVHYAPRGSEEGMFGYIAANNDEGVYEWIKSEPSINSHKKLYSSYEDREEESYDIYDENYKLVGAESFKEKMIRLCGEMNDPDAEVDDTYYGVTLLGWSIIKEDISDTELGVMEELGILIGKQGEY